jgi:hypothetical protein
MGNIVLTDELLDEIGEEYDKKKTEEILTGVHEEDTFVVYLHKRLRELAA